MRAKLASLLIIVGCAPAYAEPTQNDLETYAHCVLSRLLDGAGHQEGWEVVVLDEDEIALSVLPGNVLALDAGLVRFSTSTDELAAAIAHELGHALAKHDGDEDHDRDHEREASRIASSLTSAAGFAPQDGIGFWQRVAREKDSILVRLHPSPEENAHILQDNLRAAEKRYRSAVARGVAPVCERPSTLFVDSELHYASAAAEGGSR